MSKLALLSLLNAYVFLSMGLYILWRNHRSCLHQLAAGIDFCMAVWVFACACFYEAGTREDAVFWFRAGSVGWLFIGGICAHFYFVLAERVKGLFPGFLWLLFFYGPPGILFIRSLSGNTPVLAKDFVPSQLGWGWTFVPDLSSLWFWLFAIYTIFYYSAGVWAVFQWAAKKKQKQFQRQAHLLVFFTGATVWMAFFSDIVLLSVSSLTPPLFNLVAPVWAVIVFYILYAFRFQVMESVTPQLLIDTVLDPILLLDKRGRIQRCNQATADLLKCSIEELYHHAIGDFCQDEPYRLSQARKLFKQRSLRGVEFALVNKKGQEIHVMASFAIVENRWGDITGIVANLHDITRQTAFARQLAQMAYHDKLTGLPNRRALAESLEHLSEDGQCPADFTLVFIDLDGYKAVNDLYGHEVGDRLLIKIGSLLQSVLRKNDLAARIGGDEFVLIFTDVWLEEEFSACLEHLRELFLQPFMIQGHACAIGISLGISRCPEDGVAVDALLRLADQRMYEEKSRHKEERS